MACERTEQSVLRFLLRRGGRVAHTDLIDHFELNRKNDSDPDTDTDTEDGGREGRQGLLARLVDAVASVTEEDGVKFVCVKTKRVAVDGVDSVMRTDGVERNGNGVNTEEVEEEDDEHGSLLSMTSADDCVNGNGHGNGHGSGSSNGNPDHTDQTSVHEVDNEDPTHHVTIIPSTVAPGGTTTTTTTTATTTTTFAGAEVKMRERRRRESAPTIGSVDHTDHPPGHQGHQGQSQVRGARRISKACQRAMLGGGHSEDGAWEGLDALGDSGTPKGSRRNFIELMMSSSPQVRRSMIHRGSCLRDSVKSDGDSASLHSSSATDEDSCASVALDPLEHEWMLCASDSQWDSLQPLLAVEPGLVSKRDFVTGFTCLHWAAKQGKAELLGLLLAFARDSGVPVDVNGRSGAGYTPLHLAAIHCHTQVVRTLVSDWEADPEVRDYSGKRAVQYLPLPLAADLHQQGVVGPATSPSGAAETDTGNTDRGGGLSRGWRLLQSGNLNPLRLLNPPPPAATGEATEATEADAGGRGKVAVLQRKSSLGRLNARLHRGRRRAQIIHSPSFRESGAVRGDEPLCSPVRTRPLSSLFG